MYYINIFECVELSAPWAGQQWAKSPTAFDLKNRKEKKG